MPARKCAAERQPLTRGYPHAPLRQRGDWCAGDSPGSACAMMGEQQVALSAEDREILRRCLRHEPGAWTAFLDRYLDVIYHVVDHTARLHDIPLQQEDVEEIAAHLLLRVAADDYAALREFRGQSSLATYLTVI